MKLLNVLSVSAMMYGGMNAAHAGNLSELGLDDPTITPPAQCTWFFGILPCHEGFKYDESENGDQKKPQRPEEPPVLCKTVRVTDNCS